MIGRTLDYLTMRLKRQKIEYISELDKKVCNPAKFKQKDWWKLVRTYLKKKGIDSDDIPPIEVNNRTLRRRRPSMTAL